jgi:hypothetical protein
MVDLVNERSELFRCDSLPHARGDWVPAVSGLCFSDDDRYLAASSWKGRHDCAPTVLFEVSRLTLTLRNTLNAAIRGLGMCPTGVLLAGQYVVTRIHGGAPDGVFVLEESPRELGIQTVNTRHHLTNGHLAAVRNQVITAGRGLLAGGNFSNQEQVQALIDFRESGATVDEGLVSVTLDVEPRSPQLIPVQGCRRVTAIAARADGAGFLTGGSEGELDQWTWNGNWRQERIRSWTSWDSPSVSGICYLCDGGQWVVVSSSGGLELMGPHGPAAFWQIPTSGSPRALAAHPTRDWVAIGMKQGGWIDPRGVVEIVDVGLTAAGSDDG